VTLQGFVESEDTMGLDLEEPELLRDASAGCESGSHPFGEMPRITPKPGSRRFSQSLPSCDGSNSMTPAGGRLSEGGVAPELPSLVDVPLPSPEALPQDVDQPEFDSNDGAAKEVEHVEEVDAQQYDVRNQPEASPEAAHDSQADQGVHVACALAISEVPLLIVRRSIAAILPHCGN
jgi:hypothetical protein